MPERLDGATTTEAVKIVLGCREGTHDCQSEAEAVRAYLTSKGINVTPTIMEKIALQANGKWLRKARVNGITPKDKTLTAKFRN